MEFNLEQILESGNINELRADENWVMMTPLIKFTIRNDINAVLELLKAGADPNIRQMIGGVAPLEVACVRGSVQLCQEYYYYTGPIRIIEIIYQGHL